MNLDLILSSHRLFIDSYFEDIAKLFCNLEGAKTSLTKDRFLLNNWYEGYLYTLLLGIKINDPQDYKGKKMDKAPKWSHNYLSQYKYSITKLISRPDIIKQLYLSDRQSINEKFESTEELMKNIKNICDRYSNGGLKYLNDLYLKDASIFNNYESLKIIYEEAGH